jgi:hypothetical protein
MPNTNDDPWADLYADLGVTDKPTYRAPEPLPPAVEENFVSSEDEDDDEGEDTEIDGVSVAGSGEGDGEEDPNKKKRRRRRRRGKKKPGEATSDEAPREVVAILENGEEDAEPEEELETAGTPEPALEGATSEMTRELIANWNVPSWEEIVAGLYRPNH